MDLAASVDRVLKSSEVFGELFYDEFFRRCPEARTYFEGQDMKRQALVMTMTLQSVQQHASGDYPAVDGYLGHLGGLHRRRHIPMEMYPPFRSAMLHTLSRMLSDEWDAELATQWEIALDKTIRRMLGGYEHPPGV